jgi:hypothetical protein
VSLVLDAPDVKSSFEELWRLQHVVFCAKRQLLDYFSQRKLSTPLRLSILATRLLSVLNALQAYLYQSVFGSSPVAFSASSDLETMHAVVVDWLTSLKDMSFLSARASAVHTHLLNLIGLCSKVRPATTPEVVAMAEEDMARSFNFITAIIALGRQQRSHTHLEQLLLRLDMRH